MKSLVVTIDWQNQPTQVGVLNVGQVRGHEHYQFSYSSSWMVLEDRFSIDPALQLTPGAYYTSRQLWGVFQDISPDRWGKMVQDRTHNHYLTATDYMLGVSDYMRIGAIRLSDPQQPNVYLAQHKEIPKLVHLAELEKAVQRLEAGQETKQDLDKLVAPGSSLGGAHPKVAIEHNGQLWIAKLQSNHDTERVGLWESTLLTLARQAGINTAHHQVLNQNGQRPVLLVERFDRQGTQRIPFMSAMTLLELNEENKESASYIDLADSITCYSSQPKTDKHELWRRMTFNALAGNTDDHLRNHAFLKDRQGWHLSPAYDLNPVKVPFQKRTHSLSFDGEQRRPSLDHCIAIADYFGVQQTQLSETLKKMAATFKQWESIARQNGLKAEEIKRMENAFKHKDTEQLFMHYQ